MQDNGAAGRGAASALSTQTHIFQMVTMEDGICQGADEHMSTFKHAASGRQIHFCAWCSLVVSLNDAVSVIVPFAPMIRVWLD